MQCQKAGAFSLVLSILTPESQTLFTPCVEVLHLGIFPDKTGAVMWFPSPFQAGCLHSSLNDPVAKTLHWCLGGDAQSIAHSLYFFLSLYLLVVLVGAFQGATLGLSAHRW